MSIFAFLAIALASGTTVEAPLMEPQFEHVEVGYAALSRGNPAEAIATIASAGSNQNDPVVLINLAAANAKLGHIQEARRLLQSARTAPDRFDVQLSDGRWMDSREAARLAESKLARQEALAMR